MTSISCGRVGSHQALAALLRSAERRNPPWRHSRNIRSIRGRRATLRACKPSRNPTARAVRVRIPASRRPRPGRCAQAANARQAARATKARMPQSFHGPARSGKVSSPWEKYPRRKPRPGGPRTMRGRAPAGQAPVPVRENTVSPPPPRRAMVPCAAERCARTAGQEGTRPRIPEQAASEAPARDHGRGTAPARPGSTGSSELTASSMGTEGLLDLSLPVDARHLRALRHRGPQARSGPTRPGCASARGSSAGSRSAPSRMNTAERAVYARFPLHARDRRGGCLVVFSACPSTPRSDPRRSRGAVEDQSANSPPTRSTRSRSSPWSYAEMAELGAFVGEGAALVGAPTSSR